MTDRQQWAWLVATGLLTIAAMVVGAAMERQLLSIMAGAMMTVVTAAVGWIFAARASPADADQRAVSAPALTAAPRDAVAARFARLMGTLWVWSGLAMLGSYYLTDLSWQHAWQYGAAMLLIGGFVWTYAANRERPGSRFADDDLAGTARWMTRLQGIAVLAGLIFLMLGDKLHADKADWAANVVFIAGGLALYSLSRAALQADDRAMRGTASSAPRARPD